MSSDSANSVSKRTTKIQLMLSDEELDAIDAWRFEKRLPSRSAAIRELIRRGLIYDDKFQEPVPAAPSGDFSVTEPPDTD